MEIICKTGIAFELGYLKKDVFENILEKGKKTIGKNEQLYCVNQNKQHLNHISTTFTTIFKQYFRYCKNI